uniref:Uncharacterized protein n=1 Tax=Bigelowiella natans TaxID=227086 RepID=A0A7S2KP24_BIGNA|mmetsp:Transcript_932/g.1455  ORF Transcript_932/g.1455 Transcript_932/m.1455 type:complete len:383 (+) Transcript_932:152-1300(+)
MRKRRKGSPPEVHFEDDRSKMRKKGVLQSDTRITQIVKTAGDTMAFEASSSSQTQAPGALESNKFKTRSVKQFISTPRGILTSSVSFPEQGQSSSSHHLDVEPLFRRMTPEIRRDSIIPELSRNTLHSNEGGNTYSLEQSQSLYARVTTKSEHPIYSSIGGPPLGSHVPSSVTTPKPIQERFALQPITQEKAEIWTKAREPANEIQPQSTNQYQGSKQERVKPFIFDSGKGEAIRDTKFSFQTDLITPTHVSSSQHVSKNIALTSQGSSGFAPKNISSVLPYTPTSEVGEDHLSTQQTSLLEQYDPHQIPFVISEKELRDVHSPRIEFRAFDSPKPGLYDRLSGRASHVFGHHYYPASDSKLRTIIRGLFLLNLMSILIPKH